MSRAWQFTLDRLEPSLRIKIARARNAFIEECINSFNHNSAIPNWLMTRHARNIEQILSGSYETTINEFNRLLRRQIRRKSGGYDPEFASRIHEWIATQSFLKAELISGTDLQDVRDAIHNGIDAGEGASAIAKRIRAKRSLTVPRAATIARTETNAAATYGYIESARQAEQDFGMKLMKVWEPTLDGRTRDDHRNMINHPPIPMNEKFNVGGAWMDRPGDSGAPGDAGVPAEQVINCRCGLSVQEE